MGLVSESTFPKQACYLRHPSSRVIRKKVFLDTLRERALKNIKMDAKSVSRLTVALMLPFTDTEDIKE